MSKGIELVLRREIQGIFDSFAAAFGISIVFHTPEGEQLTRGLGRKNATFCQMVQEELFSPAKCLSMDMRKSAEAAAARKVVGYRCHAGVEEAVAPIFIEGKLAGFAMIGQFRTGGSLSPATFGQCSSPERRERLETAFAALPVFSAEVAENILKLFTVLVDYIVTKELVTLKGDRGLSLALDFMRANLGRGVKLAEVAKAAGKSPSGLSHLFTGQLGASFKSTLIEMRLDAAEELFRKEPALTLAEVAVRVGFDDQFYFSRLYKQRRGVPPSQSRHVFAGTSASKK